MFDPAGVLVGRFGGHAQGLHQEFCNDPVAFVDFARFIEALLGKQDLPAFLHRDILRAFQDADRAADAGLGVIQLVRDVHRADIAELVLKYQNGFKVVFTRLVYTHVSLL
ncbi:hypothetical protein SDC9_211173 [bioreactor metagenome]|uniref:Uncharacterized protein n=1 Tax=bioreactor metagenome TaxID=1076179 RepID=A0A645JU18_9ZZZZ